jgi:hypothetical protein
MEKLQKYIKLEEETRGEENRTEENGQTDAAARHPGGVKVKDSTRWTRGLIVTSLPLAAGERIIGVVYMNE